MPTRAGELRASRAGIVRLVSVMLMHTWQAGALRAAGAAGRAGACFAAVSHTIRPPRLQGLALGSPRDPSGGLLGRGSARGSPFGQVQVSRLRPLAGLGGRVCMSSGVEAAGGAAEKEEAVCVVRCIEGEPHMSIEVEIAGKVRSMNRMQEDPCDGALERLAKLWAEGHGAKVKGRGKKKKVKGKGKRRQAAAAEAEAAAAEDEEREELPVGVEITCDKGLPVDMYVCNKDAWLDGRVLTIVRGEVSKRFVIRRNEPAVDKLVVHVPPMVGFPLQAEYELEFADEEVCEWAWYRADEGADDGYVRVHDGQSYAPTEEDVGRVLAVECVPARVCADGGVMRGGAEVFELDEPVSAGPDLSLFRARFEHAASAGAQERRGMLRVVSYNILADNYANTPFARDSLYKHCPNEFLALSYRKQLYVHELVRYDGDVMCLQEVARDVYDSFIVPQLAKAGYTGVFANKLSIGNIGCATFFKHDKYTLEGSHLVDLTNGWREHDDLRKLCSGDDVVCASMRSALEKSTTIAQVLMLAPTDGGGGRVCVVNTHLFGHPDATHVRLVQTATMSRQVCALLQRKGPAWEGAARVVCGDMNSLPEEGVAAFLTAGGVGKDHQDWWRGLRYEHIASREEREARWFEKNSAEGIDRQAGLPYDDYEARPCLDLPCEVQLRRACADVGATICMSKGPQVVDYIFFPPDKLEEREPFPSFPVGALEQDGGLPSYRFPSDHVALVADLYWKE